MLDEYRRLLNLPEATFLQVEHEDAMVATVFKITKTDGKQIILKICSRKADFLREAYFLSHFNGKIPVPKVIQLIEPGTGVDGAVLIEYLSGNLLSSETIKQPLARDIGSFLALIHLEHSKGYGDLIEPVHLTDDPRFAFTAKFEEGLDECKGHLSESLIEICKHHFYNDIDYLLKVDGPCIIHRDFRPGNLIVLDEKLQGIIDWSSARGGFAEEDFCPLEFGEWPMHCKKSFLEGYASVRKVPDYKTIMPLLRLSRAIAAVGFTVKTGTWKSKNSKFYQFNLRYLESLISV